MGILRRMGEVFGIGATLAAGGAAEGGQDNHAKIVDSQESTNVDVVSEDSKSVDSMVDGLNHSTIDETSGTSEIELNGIKFTLEPGYDNLVIANVIESDGTEKSVVLKKDDSSGNNVWSLEKGHDADQLRGARQASESIKKVIASK